MTNRYQSEKIKELVNTTEDKEKLLALLIFEGKHEQVCVEYISSMIGQLYKGNMLWFSWEDDQLRSLFSSGLSDVAIASEMNTTHGSVTSRRKKLSLNRYQHIENEAALVFQIKQLIEKKLTVKLAAQELGYSVATLSKVCKRNGLSFKKLASDHHRSKVSAYDRAVISALHDKGYMPEHISNALKIPLSTVRCVAWNVPSTQHVDVTQDERVKPLLNCEKRFGHYMTPAEVELFNKEGIQAFMDKTGRTEETSMMTFVYRQQKHRFEMMGACL